MLLSHCSCCFILDMLCWHVWSTFSSLMRMVWWWSEDTNTCLMLSFCDIACYLLHGSTVLNSDATHKHLGLGHIYSPYTAWNMCCISFAIFINFWQNLMLVNSLRISIFPLQNLTYVVFSSRTYPSVSPVGSKQLHCV